MSAEMKNKVKDLLKTYNERERKIALLQFQMENPPLVTLNEQIEAMNYGHGDGLGHTQGRVSNKTLFIALNYEEQAERLNAQASSEIAEELFELKQKQKRLKYYIALLDKRQSEVVRLLYLEEVAPNEVAGQLGVTYRTVDRVRKAAILALAEMYAYADSFKL